jgi:hypothetical protein
MTIRSLTQHLQRWKRRPRFGTPGLGIALALFLAAALVMMLTRGSTAPARPAEPAAPASRARTEKPAPVPPASPPEAAVPAPSVPVPESEERCPKGCEVPPPGCFIKGNVSPKTGERIYHLPEQQFYDDTRITPGKGEAWFCTEEEARVSGWRKAKR